VAAARRSVLLLPLFACSPSRVGQFSKKIDFWSGFLTNFRPIFDKEFPKFDYDPFGF